MDFSLCPAHWWQCFYSLSSVDWRFLVLGSSWRHAFCYVFAQCCLWKLALVFWLISHLFEKATRLRWCCFSLPAPLFHDLTLRRSWRHSSKVKSRCLRWRGARRRKLWWGCWRPWLSQTLGGRCSTWILLRHVDSCLCDCFWGGKMFWPSPRKVRASLVARW